MDIAAIESRRKRILDDMESIRAMRPGTVTEQFLLVPHKGKEEPVRRGPYYLWQFYEQGKPVRRRVAGEELAQAQFEVCNHKRFLALCKEYEELTERLGQLEREAADAEEAVKKKPKSKLPKTKKSNEQ
jgi:ribosomal protein S10